MGRSGDGPHAPALRQLLELSHALQLSVVAEGVETSDQLGNLQTAGCDTAQGFLFSRPEQPDVIDALVLAGSSVPPTPDAGGEAKRRKRRPPKASTRRRRRGGRRRRVRRGR